MAQRRLTITRQLVLSFTVMLALLAALGTLSWYQAHRLWRTTYTLYNHPLQVRRAIGEIRADVLRIHLAMKDIILTTDIAAREKFQQRIAEYEQDCERQFNTLHARFLGDKRDIYHAEMQFVRWRSIREQTLRILDQGDRALATKRTMRNGEGGQQAMAIFKELEDISDFAFNKGNSLYREAEAVRQSVLLQLSTVVLSMLLLAVVMGGLLLRAIRTPIAELSAVAERFRAGDYSVRSTTQAGNELGDLSRTFNRLADTIEENVWVKDSIALLQEVGVGETTRKAYCNLLLTTLITRIDVQFGACYSVDPGKEHVALIAAMGLDSSLPDSESVKSGEGIFGVVLASRAIHRVREIPSDTVFLAPMVAGSVLPREIVAVPLHSGEDLVGVLILGGVREMSDAALRVLESARFTIGARIAALSAGEHLRALAGKLEMQNRELETQSHELGMQADELSEQNIILAMQKSQLNEANRLKSTFLSNMSHELRTPLNSVIALSGVLGRRLRGNIGDEEYGYLDIIERNGRHLLSLINNILDLARIEAGREDVSISTIAVRALIEDVIVLLRPQAEEKGLVLEARIADNVPVLRTDAAKCRQVLINLIGNAVKFTEAGLVRVNAHVEGTMLHVDVSDTGPGIAPEHAQRIFEEFQQVDGGTDRRYEGSGLGLAIARRYAALLGGSITLESTPGEGATFTLCLPLLMEESDRSTQARRTSASGEAPRGDGNCVLVVEDDEGVRLQLHDILVRNGYRVVTAGDGEEALRRIDDSMDGIILDLMMPHIDGFEVLRQLRTHPSGQGIPVLILTAKHVNKEELAFLQGNNIHELIRKGDISGTELLQLVADMLDSGKSKQTRELSQPSEGHFAQLSHKPNVLVVEDNPDNMTTVLALLGDFCELLSADDGHKALELARRSAPDLVLLDISLPGMDGFQVLEQLRTLEHCRSIPVVALTARALTEDRNEILARGFDAYLAKPVDATQLETTIVSMLHGK